MNRLFKALVVSGFVIFLPSCASVGAVIEGGKAFTTGVIDESVNAVSTVSVAVLQDASSIATTAATIASNTVETVANEVDKQTDELQDTPEKKD